MNLLARSNTEAVDDFRSNITFNCEKGEKSAKIRLTLVMSGDVVERSTNLIVLWSKIFKMQFDQNLLQISWKKNCTETHRSRI